ncbi:MAG: hypothetical protein DWQ36_25220 [Acidobacteria bacterium]|nr:MAG: hypothetical protein DWQ30_02170 [Acidobacteriota bacterium]REJ99520.1 MAG: hypothetical protein DWQ36_25220 [Acidobacteriota bacterium]
MVLSLCVVATVVPAAAQEYGASLDGGAAAFELAGGQLTYQIFVAGGGGAVTINGTNIGANFRGNGYAAGTTAFGGGDIDGANLQIQGGPSATIVRTGDGGGGGEPPDTSPCAEDAGCVLDDRFEVIVTVVDGQGVTRAGIPNDLTNDTDWFYYEGLDPNNVEVFVKVPAGTCGLNNFFWVFAGGATDVDVTIRVRDTDTGEVRTYTRTGAFQAVNDTGAFATCPQ